MKDDGTPTPEDAPPAVLDDGTMAVDPVTGQPMTVPSSEWLNANATWPYSAGAFIVESWYEVFQIAELAENPDAMPDSMGVRNMMALRFRTLTPEGPRQQVLMLPVDRAESFARNIITMAELSRDG